MRFIFLAFLHLFLFTSFASAQGIPDPDRYFTLLSAEAGSGLRVGDRRYLAVGYDSQNTPYLQLLPLEEKAIFYWKYEKVFDSPVPEETARYKMKSLALGDAFCVSSTEGVVVIGSCYDGDATQEWFRDAEGNMVTTASRDRKRLCAVPDDQGRVHMKSVSTSKTQVAQSEFCSVSAFQWWLFDNNSPANNVTNTQFELDIVWASSHASVPEGYYGCNNWYESADNFSVVWQDNFLCTPANLGFEFVSGGPALGKKCISINEPGEPSSSTWGDNYFCVPENFRLNFSWHFSGRPTDRPCVHIKESAELPYWRDNYLCWTQPNLLNLTGMWESIPCHQCESQEQSIQWGNTSGSQITNETSIKNSITHSVSAGLSLGNLGIDAQYSEEQEKSATNSVTSSFEKTYGQSINRVCHLGAFWQYSTTAKIESDGVVQTVVAKAKDVICTTTDDRPPAGPIFVPCELVSETEAPLASGAAQQGIETSSTVERCRKKNEIIINQAIYGPNCANGTHDIGTSTKTVRNICAGKIGSCQIGNLPSHFVDVDSDCVEDLYVEFSCEKGKPLFKTVHADQGSSMTLACSTDR